MNYDKKCKWHKSCGYDFCHGEGICPEFEKGKPPDEDIKNELEECNCNGKRNIKIEEERND